jgi:glutamyl/glutaminyl-tRNA synthetase
MSKDELVKHFDLERVHKGGAKFDPDKTKWFNQQYLRMRPDAELGAQLQAKLKDQGIDTTAERATAGGSAAEGARHLRGGHAGRDLPVHQRIAAEDNAPMLPEELRKRWKPEAAPALRGSTSLNGHPARTDTAVLDFHASMRCCSSMA